MNEYLKSGKAIVGNNGGLILGKTHEEGGIYFWVKRNDVYVLKGEVEGFEYILNAGATKYYYEISDRFHQITEEDHIDFEGYKPQKKIKVLNTNSLSEPKFILFDNNDFAIVNKCSSKAYLETLDKMNKAISYEFVGENMIRLIRRNNEIIPIKFNNQVEGYIKDNQVH